MDAQTVGRQTCRIKGSTVYFSCYDSQCIKKNDLKPWQRKQWCIGNITGEYIARMENILHLYEQPYDPLLPVICSDERPCQLIGDTVSPLPASPGKAAREDYHYERNGTCALLSASEPLSGRRYVEVSETRTEKDYACFMGKLADCYYPCTEKIRVVRDNPNTHSAGSFYAAFASEKASELAQRSEFHLYTDQSRRLNMVEIEISAIATECLHRRIPDIETLRREVRICVGERNKQKATVRWRSTKIDAGKKMERHYPVIQI